MSLAAVAAAATVYDDINLVASDVGMSVEAAHAVVVQNGIASVDGYGRVSMSEAQSLRAAAALDGWDS